MKHGDGFESRHPLQDLNLPDLDLDISEPLQEYGIGLLEADSSIQL